MANFIKNTANICIDCLNACGKCPWTAVDPKTGAIRFEPVEGWDAEEVTLLLRTDSNGNRVIVQTYKIKSCPLFEKDDRKHKRDTTALSPAESKWFLENIRSILRGWADGE